MDLKKQLQTLKELLDNSSNETFENYLKLRMLKVRIEQSKKVALKHGGNIIPCKLTGNDLEMFKQINLNIEPLKDFENIKGETL